MRTFHCLGLVGVPGNIPLMLLAWEDSRSVKERMVFFVAHLFGSASLERTRVKEKDELAKSLSDFSFEVVILLVATQACKASWNGLFRDAFLTLSFGVSRVLSKLSAGSPLKLYCQMRLDSLL